MNRDGLNLWHCIKTAAPSNETLDATVAQQIEAKTAEKLKSQSASPGTDAALRRLVEGIISSKPN
jgi:hypothetical protein